MKWNKNGIQFRRGCYETLIAQFDGCGNWWTFGGMATQQTMRSMFKRLGEYFGASHCEVKALFDDNDLETEESVVYFRFSYDERLLVADDATQKYIPYHN